MTFDTGILYRRDTLEFIDAEAIITRHGTRNLKIAHRAEFGLPHSNEPLHLFVSHWPARLWSAREPALRNLLGTRLRDAYVELIAENEGPMYAILLGDFNDEPFDDPLSYQLLATRDRRLAQRSPEYLYNPFWRHLGEPTAAENGEVGEGYPGSYFHSSGVESRWRTMDQMIFSHAFLKEGEWGLNEHDTLILQIPPIDGAVKDSSRIFDHFPVLGVIEREMQNG